jgi:integrase
MSDVERYLRAAERPNTARSYAGALRHFEEEWGGALPATADSLARYLAAYAGKLSANTLRLRLAAIARWHQDHGFADPTHAPLVRAVIKGIQTEHPHIERQAEPIQIGQIAEVDAALEATIQVARAAGDRGAELRALRNRALMLLGFWRGFRGDELIRLRIEHLRIVPGQGMICFLARSKADRQAQGRSYKVPALARWCAVDATMAWIAETRLSHGELFRRVDRHGHIAQTPLHPNSLIRIIRATLAKAGIDNVDAYSSHSLRRGFAGWANAAGWDIKTLMAYVGWRDVQSAMRYIEAGDPFSRRLFDGHLLENALPELPAPTSSNPI